jgi:hypothetical protein
VPEGELAFVGANPLLPHHVAFYNGKAVVMDYVKDPKQEFKRAAQRVDDNTPYGVGVKGHVLTPNGKVFELTHGSRSAKQVPVPEYILAAYPQLRG